MTISIPQKVGKAKELLPRKSNMTILVQKFRNPKTGRVYERLLVDGLFNPSLVLAITKDKRIVAIRHFRHAANKPVLEIPGGTMGRGVSPRQAARKELEEETGYRAGKLIPLSRQPIWFEPTTLTVRYYSFLALDCVPSGKPVPQESDLLELKLIPISTWLRMIRNGTISDSKTVATTMLALPYLRHIPWRNRRSLRT